MVQPFDNTTNTVFQKAARWLIEHDLTAHLVGGSVRDGLLGLKTKDIDMAVDGSAHETGRDLADHLRGHFVSLDRERDIVRVVVAVDTQRVFIDLSRIVGQTIQEDLWRRDFTVDAMAVSLEDALSGAWNVVDPTGGMADVEAGRIRTVSENVFKDDPLRLLRAVRLAAQTGFRIESETEELITRSVGDVLSASPERIREELFRTLAQPQAGEWVELMDRLGILSVLIPELDVTRGVDQPREHYYDVFGHLKAAVTFADQIVTDSYDPTFIGQMIPRFEGMDDYFEREITDGHTRGTALKLTALLHDIAKPQTKTVEPSGRVRFFGHSEEGEEITGTVLRRLRVGRRGVAHVKTMVRHHLRPRQMDDRGRLPTVRAIYRYFRDVGDAALDTLYLNMADFLAARGPLLTPSEMEVQVRVIDHILRTGPQRQTRANLKKGLLTGHDIMRELSLDPSPVVGRLLRAVAQAEAEGQVNSREEALELARTHLESGGGNG